MNSPASQTSVIRILSYSIAQHRDIVVRVFRHDMSINVPWSCSIAKTVQARNCRYFDTIDNRLTLYFHTIFDIYLLVLIIGKESEISNIVSKSHAKRLPTLNSLLLAIGADHVLSSTRTVAHEETVTQLAANIPASTTIASSAYRRTSSAAANHLRFTRSRSR